MRGSSRTLAPRIWLCRRLFLAVCTLWALTSTLDAHAGDNTWSPLGPDGGAIWGLAFHNTSPNTLYLKASAGFFRSTDGGAHWQQPQPEIMALASDFAVDPTDNDRIYLVLRTGPSRVLVSTDAGVTFSTLFRFEKIDSTPTHIVVSADGNTLYAIFFDCSVFRSTDRGRSWQQRTDYGDNLLVGRYRALIDPSDANTLYIVRNAQLRVTHDGAGTWANITPPSGGVLDVALNPTDSNELWAATPTGLNHSSNGGASWSLADAGPTQAVALDPRSPSTVYAARPRNILRRSGGTWSDITSDLGGFDPELIAVSPHHDGTVLVVNNRGLWITSNSGGSWARRDAGVVSTGVVGFAVASDRIYTKGYAVAKLDPGSDSVTAINVDGLFQLMGLPTFSVGVLAPVPESGGGLIAALGNYIGRTLDDGATWNFTGYAPLADDSVVDLAATSSAPSVYYASSRLTLQRSVDQGATWTPIVTGLPAGQSPGLIAIAPSNPSIIYAGPRSPRFSEFTGEGVGVYKSTNAGDSWTPANTGIENRGVRAIAVHPTDPDIVYIGTENSLMKTANGGATWTELPWFVSSPGYSAQVRAIAIDPRAPDTIYAAGYGSVSQVARSTDGGATWTALAEPTTFFPWQPWALAVDTARPDTLLVGTIDGGIRQMSIRPDLQPDLAIQLTPRSNDLPLLAPTEHRFTISNLGPGPTGEVVASIRVSALGAELAVDSSTGTCILASLTIDCMAPPLDANATMDIVVTVTPTQRGPVTFDGSVYTDRVDAQVSNNTVIHTTLAFERARLVVDIAGPANVQAGDSVQYTATITSEGPTPASDAYVAFSTAPGITRGPFSITAGACVSTGLNSLVCEIGTLNAGAVVTLTVNGTIAQAGTYNVHSTAGRAGGVDDEIGFSTNASAPPAPQPPPGNGGTSSGGGGAASPLMLLGLLAMLFGRGLLSDPRPRARRSAGRPTVCT